jgi:ribosomal protein L11 methyltransferase
MFSLVIGSDESDGSRDGIIERLWLAGTLGIVEGPTTLEAFFESESVIEQLADLHPKRIEPEAVDWEEETKRSFPPVLAGERFFLVPPWNEDPTPEGRERLVINPGTACGTGYHPCTQMCLAMLEALVRPGTRVADVGAGSGILSKAASLLGAGPIHACDIDPDAVEQCEWPVKFVGSADALASGSADLLIANISAEVHRELLPEYRRVARTLILSGFEQMEPVSGEIQRVEKEGWFAIVVACSDSPQDS